VSAAKAGAGVSAQVHVVRGDLVESRHEIALAVADRHGEVRWQAGTDPGLTTYFRSSAKPFQALAAVEAGVLEAFAFGDRELAVMCASHSGTAAHTAVVASMLERIGLGVDALQCGVHPPLHEPSARALREAGSPFSALHSNCSGKHTGMLSFARHLGADVATYRLPTHPIQVRIKRTVSEMTGVPEAHIAVGVDGCGAPVFGVPVTAMATAFARLADPVDLPPRRQEAIARVVRAMTTYPDLVAGPERFDTVVMETTRGRVVSKAGAEGVQCMALPELGLGVALKVLDGNGRATGPAAMEALVSLGVLSEAERAALAPYHQPPVRNVAGAVVGEIYSQFILRKVAQRGR